MWRHGGALQERILYALAPGYTKEHPANPPAGNPLANGVADDAGG
jgi:hypothetical protein